MIKCNRSLSNSIFLNARTGPQGGFAGGPFPSQLYEGTNYSLSVFAKADTEGVVLDLRPCDSLGVNSATSFNLTTSWERYEVVGTATANTKQSVSSYTLKTVGTAWLDKLDVHQLNNCPTNANSTAGFFGLQLAPFDKSIPTATPLNANASGCCEAGWMAGVDFQKLCEARHTEKWFWFYPDSGPYLCCKGV